jgi:LysR family glycine cleavage system transcriptional activator
MNVTRLSRSLSLGALEAFEAVARHRSFTLAARELHVTQGAVSHRVRALEAQLGYPLLTRSTREVVLTERGAMLARGVSSGLTAIEDALQSIQDQMREATLAVSCSPSFAIRWLVRRLERFREQHPDTAVHVAASDQLEQPGRGGVDVCVRYGAGQYPGLSVSRLSHEEVFVVASPALIARVPLSRESQLLNHQLIHHDVMRDHPENVSWERYLSPKLNKSRDPGRRGLHFSHAHMALEAAAAAQGVALARTTLVADDLAAGRLCAPLRRRLPSGLAYWFITARDKRNDPHITRFRSWLASELA